MRKEPKALYGLPQMSKIASNITKYQNNEIFYKQPKIPLKNGT